MFVLQQSLFWPLTVGTRLPRTLNHKEEERVFGTLFIQKARVFPWLVYAELPAKTARDRSVQARGQQFHGSFYSFVQFLRPTVT